MKKTPKKKKQKNYLAGLEDYLDAIRRFIKEWKTHAEALGPVGCAEMSGNVVVISDKAC